MSRRNKDSQRWSSLFGMPRAVGQGGFAWDWPGGVKTRRTARGYTSLHLEQLEARVLFAMDELMSVSGSSDLVSINASSESVSPTWFADLSGAETPRHAGSAGLSSEGLKEDQVAAAVEPTSFDWIVRFDTGALAGITSVVQTTTLLAGGGIEFQALRGLGLVGQVLVRSYGASAQTVENWLASDANVEHFERDSLQQVKTTPNDPSWSSLWGLENTGQTGGRVDADIDAPAAWNISTGSRNVVVAVIDTGVDYNHPDLAANIWTNTSEIPNNGIDDDGDGFIDDAHGYNFASENGNVMDDNGHGTHVAGTIGAVGNNATGVTGINWNVSILPLKFLDANGSGYTSDAVRAINYCTMQRSRGVNIRVINNSWGGTGYSSSLADAVQAAGNAGILVVAAAGNDGQNTDVNPHYPSNLSSANVISVAATDANDALAGFSNYGVATVDLGAPGVSIYSTLPNNRYGLLSGTSMATPHVAGVAALAWAVAPNATVSEIRNAIFQGVDAVPSLQGKVATGGRLNAYNTLQLLNTGGARLPYIDYLAASPALVTLGGTTTLVARGVADTDGTVASVSFYEDTNGNNQWDAGDRLLGVDTNVGGGEARITVNTAGYSTGNHVFFARALDNQSQWSPAVSAVLRVMPPDDHGNDASTATHVAVGNTVGGVIDYGGDSDWFSFDAVAGRSYVLQTTLNTLADSVLYLYDRNGTTLLEMNDDWGGTLASRIAWTAPTTGTYYLAVEAYNTTETGSYRLSLTAVNVPPVMAAIGDQTMSYRQDTLSVTVNASDPDGTPLSYSAQIYATDPVGQRAYDLDRQLGLFYPGGYSTNYRGYGEKYLQGSGGAWYFVLPNGELHAWSGAIATSPLVATFTAPYYNDPSLLWNAQAPGVVPSTVASARWAGNVLTVDPQAGFLGEFRVLVTASDGLASAQQWFRVSVTNSAPVVPVISDATMSHASDTLSVAIPATDADGDPLSYTAQVGSVDTTAYRAYRADQQLGLFYPGGYSTNYRGYGEKYLQGSGGAWYFLLPNGELHTWNGAIETSPLFDTFSTACYNDPSLLWNAQAPASTPTTSVKLSFTGNTLIVDPDPGVTGTFRIQVNVGDGANVTQRSFYVSVTNSAPVLAPIADRTMSALQDTLTVALSATDADGDPLTYSTQVFKVDPVSQRAYQWDQQLGLSYPGGYSTNFRGYGEKYLQGSGGQWYFVLPSGELHLWTGGITTSPLLDTFTAAYYSDPSLLWNAQAPVRTPSNDAAALVAGNTLTIDPPAGYSGELYVQVRVSDGLAAREQTFRVTVTNSAPSIGAIGDQSMSHTVDSRNIALAISDADGEPLTVTAALVSADPMAQRAYQVDQQFGLFYPGGYSTNCRGYGEKYLQGAAGSWYYVLPNGELHLWTGSVASSPVVATFSTAYYDDPSLLWNAQAPATLPTTGVSLRLAGNVLTVDPDPGVTGDFCIQVSASDGTQTTRQSFRFSVTDAAPVIGTIGDQSMSRGVASRDIPLAITDADGEPLTVSATLLAADPMPQRAYELDQQLGLFYPGGYSTNYRGYGEKYLQGNAGAWYFVLPAGELHAWTGTIAGSPLVETFSTAYYNDPSLLWNAQRPAPLPTTGVSLRLAGNTLTVDPDPGVTGNYLIQVSASDGPHTVRQSFHFAVTNAAPTLAPIADRTMSTQQDTLAVALSATDPDGDPMSYTGQVLAVDGTAQRAYNTDQRLGLFYPGGYSTNYRGYGEKYLQGNAGAWYFVLPNGELHAWTGTIAGSPLVETFSTAYYNDPSLLWNAQAPVATPTTSVKLRFSGNTLTVDPDPGVTGSFRIQVSASDGLLSSSQVFLLQVTQAGGASVSSLGPEPNAAVTMSATSLTPATSLGNEAAIGRIIDSLLEQSALVQANQTAETAPSLRAFASVDREKSLGEVLEQRLDVLASLMRQLEADEEMQAGSQAVQDTAWLHRASRTTWEPSESLAERLFGESRRRGGSEEEILRDLYSQLNELDANWLEGALEKQVLS